MKKITKSDIARAEQVLIDNGIDEDEAETVLQAVGYVLLGEELYPEDMKKRLSRIEFVCTSCAVLAACLAVFFMKKNVILSLIFALIACGGIYAPDIISKKRNN